MTYSPITFTRRHALGTLAAVVGLPGASLAQSDRPVRLIVNTTAGSGVDAIARAVQSALAQALGSTVVIENQAGAGGLIGAQTVARANPDGSTIGFATNNIVIFPSVLKSVPFDVNIDFTPIAIIGDIPLVIVANPSRMPVSNAKEFIATLKSKANTLNYASSGTGTIIHLAIELLLDQVGVKINHIPYKGVAPMMTDVIGGQVDFACAALPVAQPHLRSGALRAIGVSTPSRAPFEPEIPTFAEQGVPGYAAEAWLSVLGPKGMTPALVRRYHAALTTAFATPAVKEAMIKQATVINITSPEVAQATIRRDFTKYANIVKKLGLEPQ